MFNNKEKQEKGTTFCLCVFSLVGLFGFCSKNIFLYMHFVVVIVHVVCVCIS